MNPLLWLEAQLKGLPLDPRAMAQGMGTAPSEGAARFGSNFLPGAGDFVGLAQDAEMFYREPESRTPLNALMAMAGVLPLIPSAGRWTQEAENAWIDAHKTGWIPSHAYEGYEAPGGLDWLGGPDKYPNVVKKRGDVEFRKSGNRNKYVKHDEAQNIIRDENGMAAYMSDDEILAAGLPVEDETIVAFIGGRPAGFASNEWGAPGVWVGKDFQRQGIGSDLLDMLLTQNPDRFKKLGQMTNAGEEMARKYYKRKVQGAK